MSSAAPIQDPYLRRPLDGLQLIEASAGTGKTYTLATLFTRLIVERGLRMDQVLAVTYTDAATQELRKRIRKRLALAATLVGTVAATDEPHENTVTRAIVERHLADGEETPRQLAMRLRTAAEETDLAAISTIHGFCARVLHEHALETGHGLQASELIGNARALFEEVAADLWRAQAADAATAEALSALWNGPDALAADLPALCGPLPLLPKLEAGDAETQRPILATALTDRAARLIQAIAEHEDAARSAVAAAFDGKVFDGVRAKRPSFDKAFAELRQGVALAHWPRTDKTHLQKLLPASLAGFCKDGQGARVPVSPLFDALRDWCEADDAWQALQRRAQVALLHRLRDEARRRMDLLKRARGVQTYDDLIGQVADALEGPHRRALVAQLREQYRVALVDEFQDTDERQWRIFARVFGDSDDARALGLAPALFLIGDPKQAIYGFRGGDVAAYLAARRDPATVRADPLAHNFRSRPGVLAALQALYDVAGSDAFAHAEIAFEPIQPGGRRDDADYLRDGAPAPALTLRVLRNESGGAFDAEGSRAAAAAACVADIHSVLSDARDDRATVDGRRVRPGDIAVLVRSHREAKRMQQALARAGVPAVAAGKQSLFESREAADLRTLLLALLHPADGGRLRAALATVLLGEDAAALDALEADGDAQRLHQSQLLHWRDRLQRGGPFALVSELCAAQAGRLLALLDGERRLTNYLQLGELMQEASARTLGLHGLLDWLQARIADADPNDETQLLRLESDAGRVQIVTLHKSKGLEYPLVYLPFVGLGTASPDSGRHRTVHDGETRALHWRIDKDDPAWKATTALAQQDAQAEDARLLYVGLTRAEHALWIAAGDLAQFDKSRLKPLLGELVALRDRDGVRIFEGPAEAPPARLPVEHDAIARPARTSQRHLAADWWVYSFTQLAHAEGANPLAAATQADPGGEDEAPATDSEGLGDAGVASIGEVDPRFAGSRFAGSRFGVVMHAALEHADFAAWRDWQPGEAPPAGQDEVIVDALRESGYAEADLDEGVAVLAPLLGQTLCTRLPEGVRLADLPQDARRAEIEFHFAMRPTDVPALLALLHAHGVVRQRHAFGTRARLEGLMTGLVDLTYHHDGRWYVLDYKSNRLPAYDEAAMRQAMAHSEYDLQALIYTLALHRWLRFRLGDGYDYARDFGGVRYLFCRGLDLTSATSTGVHAQRFAPELVHALDALFAAGTQGGSA